MFKKGACALYRQTLHPRFVQQLESSVRGFGRAMNRHEAEATVEWGCDDTTFFEYVREDPIGRNIDLAIHTRTCGNDERSRCWLVVVLNRVPT